ncbi:LysR family transcriptional regulator [Halioglobus sp. HI00S01]|uniref:LysR family transcriptional regulator n=1 Tax=Halioglobus sp. HI00S01 TaxID=1822214 RepID=UPI0007C3D782|nr:LysR family transcriptional regulator [Halioglobus sp. HI00S01]KZX60143.1 LysR family transcriptional regulator [Halioglobus sp. HI00S01]
MDNQNLRAFLLVAETGSFSVAADRLHLTQPAVSKRVAILEDELGAALFDRIGRNVTLTEAGLALLPHAKAVEQELAAAVQSVRDLSGETRGELKLATSHHIGLHRLPPVLSAFSTAFSQVHIDIDFMDSEQAYELIHQGKVELAVVTLAPQGQSNVVSIPVWKDPLDFMIAKDHSLVAGKQAPTLTEMSQYPAILPGLNTYTGQIIKSLFDRHQLELKVSMATNYLETIRMLASVGLGWTILPRSMGDASLTQLTVREVEIQRTLGLVYHRGRSLSRAARAFIEAVQAHGDQDLASPRPASL